MYFFRHFRKSLSLISLVLFSGLFISPINAALVDNDTLVKQALHDLEVRQVVTMLEKTEIQKQLVSLGVDPIAAKERVNQLNDDELSALIENIDELPAGGDIGGTILVIFIVFVITDMLGATDVFPFVKNINR
jgi:hypothetical protein